MQEGLTPAGDSEAAYQDRGAIGPSLNLPEPLDQLVGCAEGHR